MIFTASKDWFLLIRLIVNHKIVKAMKQDFKSICELRLKQEKNQLELLQINFKDIPAKYRRRAIAKHKRRIKLLNAILELM